MMYELRGGNAFVRLSEDLETLEYGKGSLVYRTGAAFQFTCTGRIITARNISRKTVTASASRIDIDLAGFVFAARFPGNSYCRPDPRFTPDLRVRLSLYLEGEDLVICSSPMENLGNFPVQVMLAQGLMRRSAHEKAALYIPADYGLRYDFPRSDIISCVFRPSASWSLPVHGLFGPEGGIGMWCEDPDREYLLSCNTDREGTVSVRCSEIYDPMANEPREVRFMLFEAGSDFRALALRCRELRIASGRFRTLKQKAQERPVAAQLPGCVFWKHNVYFRAPEEGLQKTYSLYVAQDGWNENEGLPGNWTADEVFETAKARGFDRVAVCNTGWNRDGFDAGYPTRLPVNPERGTQEDFRSAAQRAQTLSPGYFLNVHDNYEDAYASSEEFDPDEMTQEEPGTPKRGGIWRGGQSFKMCSACGLKYAQRDLPRLAAISGPGCIYIDVFANVALCCCRSKQHPLTRRQDWQKKREICSVALKEIGALAVEGCGTDLYADLIDIGAYGCLHCGAFPARSDGPVPVPVPMWQMVYHDCVLNYFGEGYSPVHGSEYRLYQALYTLLPTAFDDHAKRISFGLRSAFTAAMTDFEELKPRSVTIEEDGSFHTHGVARSVYADGTEVIANFDGEPFVYLGKTVPARDFLIIGKDGEQATGNSFTGQ